METNQVIADANIGGIMSYIAETSLKDGDNFGYAGLWLFTGAQGSGKTLLAMHVVKKILEEYPDCILISNISIFGVPAYPYHGIEDFDKYNNGAKGAIFLIDEIHTVYSSLQSAKMPESTLTVWSQNRKNRRVIIGTSQRFNRVAKGLREQTTWNYECRRPLLGLIFTYRILDGADYDDNGVYIGDEHKILQHFYIPRVNIMRMYNTLEVVKKVSPVSEDYARGFRNDSNN